MGRFLKRFVGVVALVLCLLWIFIQLPSKRLPDRSNHPFHWKSLLGERSASSLNLGSERNRTGLPKCIDFNSATLLYEFCRDLSLTVAQRSEVDALLGQAKRTVDQLLLESVTIETHDDGESAVVGDLQPAMAQIRKELTDGLRHVLTHLQFEITVHLLEHNGFVPSGRPRHLQWRIRPEESFFVSDPRRAVGFLIRVARFVPSPEIS